MHWRFVKNVTFLFPATNGFVYFNKYKILQEILKDISTHSQCTIGNICYIRKLNKYLKVKISYLVTDYKQNKSIINRCSLCLILSNLC